MNTQSSSKCVGNRYKYALSLSLQSENTDQQPSQTESTAGNLAADGTVAGAGSTGGGAGAGSSAGGSSTGGSGVLGGADGSSQAGQSLGLDGAGESGLGAEEGESGGRTGRNGRVVLGPNALEAGVVGELALELGTGAADQRGEGSGRRSDVRDTRTDSGGRLRNFAADGGGHLRNFAADGGSDGVDLAAHSGGGLRDERRGDTLRYSTKGGGDVVKTTGFNIIDVLRSGGAGEESDGEELELHFESGLGW